MKYTIIFEAQDGNCELYKKLNANDCESACKTCPLNNALYCMDLNMHNAKIINTTLEDGSGAGVSKQFLYDWYQASIDNTKPPIWTDEHIEELFKDFYLIKK